MNLKEKFDAGYTITHKDGTTAVQVFEKKINKYDPFVIEWSDGKVACFDNSDEGKYLTCTPPKRRVITNLVVSSDGSVFPTGYDIKYQNGQPVTTITTEQQPDGTWKIV